MTKKEQKEFEALQKQCAALFVCLTILFAFTLLACNKLQTATNKLASPEVVHCSAALLQCNSLNEWRHK